VEKRTGYKVIRDSLIDRDIDQIDQDDSQRRMCVTSPHNPD